jgi:hypothetical protein
MLKSSSVEGLMEIMEKKELLFDIKVLNFHTCGNQSILTKFEYLHFIGW